MTTAEFFDEILGRGLKLRVRVTGRSMSPALVDGDFVTLRRVDPARLRRGDLVLHRGGDGRSLILHRIMETEGRDGSLIFRTRGDGLGRDDAPVPAAMVLGKVTAVERRRAGLAAIVARSAARGTPKALRRLFSRHAAPVIASVLGPGEERLG